MRVRSFTAPTMPEAMAMVRAEMGEDAVILSSERSRRGVEVKAAAERGPAALENIDAAYSRLAALEDDHVRMTGLPLHPRELLDHLERLRETSGGRIGYLRWQLWRAVRLVVDTGLHAKGWTRDQAIARMRIALSEMVVDGILTNVPLHRDLMLDANFVEGGTSIHYLEHRLAQKANAHGEKA